MDTIKTKKDVSYETVSETLSLEDNYMFFCMLLTVYVTYCYYFSDYGNGSKKLKKHY